MIFTKSARLKQVVVIKNIPSPHNGAFASWRNLYSIRYGKADTEMSIGVAIDGSGLSNGMTKTIGTSWEKLFSQKYPTGNNTCNQEYKQQRWNLLYSLGKNGKGNKATDWTPAPEDIDQNISDSQEYLIGELNKTEEKLDNVIGLVGDESVASIKQQLENAFKNEIETIERVLYGEEGDETESILSRLSDLSSETAALYTNLGEQTALIETLTGKISIEGNTVLIGDAKASKGIRIKPDEIAFLEGESKVAWITGGMLYIDAGVFLTRLKIGNHVFQSVDGNPDITIVGYEPQKQG